MGLNELGSKGQKYIEICRHRLTLIYIPDTPLDKVGFLTPMCLHRYKDGVKYVVNLVDGHYKTTIGKGAGHFVIPVK